MVKLLILFFCFLIATKYVVALTINEIYPAPETGNYEWVELYNNNEITVDLTQYILTDLANNKIKIIDNIMLPLGFIIATCSSVLNNNGDSVFLKSIAGETIEIATYSGSFSSDKSYYKCPDGNGQWFTSNMITKNTSNYPACLALTPNITLVSSPTLAPTITPTSEPTPTPTTKIANYDNIYLSEAIINPPTGEHEWVEIYNNNDFSVNLVNWYLDDLENAGSSPKAFSLTIKEKNYAVVELSTSMFNNDLDDVRLLDNDRNLKDSFEYGETEKGFSWGRINFSTDQYCLQSPSKNLPNNSCLDSNGYLSPTPLPLTISDDNEIRSSAVNSVPFQSYPKTQQTFHNYNQSVQVLGVNTNIKTQSKKKPLINSTLSFISFSNSLLTIVSLLLKIKIQEGL